MTLEELLQNGVKELEEVGVPEVELNAWYLLQACFKNKGIDFRRGDYFLRKDEEVELFVEDCFSRYIKKRKQRIPLEYITGHTEFMGLPFYVDKNVLVPRVDTETVVEYIVPHCRKKRVLDLCTGSGCIGLSIGVLGKPAQIVLSDISEDVLQVTLANMMRFREDIIYDLDMEVSLACGDLFEAVSGTFDVIVSNPPYIESGVISSLMPEVSRYEPAVALDGGADGLDFYRRIVKDAPEYLSENGILCFEIGCNQGKSVSSLMKERGFTNVRVKKDITGNDRVVSGIFATDEIITDEIVTDGIIGDEVIADGISAE